MKQIIFLYFLLFQLSMFSQTDSNISVISIEKANIVYRGIQNRIKIAVPGAKSFNVEALGVLTKVDSLGNYDWNVNAIIGRESTIRIDIVMPDNSLRHEEKQFDIKTICGPRGFINSIHQERTYEMTRKQLADLKLGITIDDLYIKRDSLFTTPIDFMLSISGLDDIFVEGNSMNEKAKSIINELSIGSIVYIKDISQYNPYNYLAPLISDIKIKVVDGPVQEISTPKPIISLSNFNIVYRGIENSLKIAVPGAKSFKVLNPEVSETASGYSWNVKQIKTNTTELDFEIVTENDSVFHTKKSFYIKDIGNLTATINGKGCTNCIIEITKEELKEAKIGISFENFFDPRWIHYVKEYWLELPDGNLYRVGEDGFSTSALKMIVQFPSGSIFKIKDITYISHSYSPRIPDMKFMLIDHH